MGRRRVLAPQGPGGAPHLLPSHTSVWPFGRVAGTAATDTRSEAMIAVSRTITAVGNFSIQYNFQAISVALIVMSAEQCTLTEEMCRDGKQAGWVMGTATATVFAGAILGQLTVSTNIP